MLATVLNAVPSDANPSLDKKMLRAVADRIVPADEKTPGATGSGAFDYLWSQLSPGGDLFNLQGEYADALRGVNALAQEQGSGENFAGLKISEQDEVLRAFEKQNPRFFARMVEHVQEGFYISQAAWDLIGWKVTA